MVSFALSEEQQMLEAMTREFVANEVIPQAEHHDRDGLYPTEVAAKAFELGLMNITIPDAYGGGDLGHMEEAIITEEIAYGCAGMAISMTVNNLSSVPIQIGGTEEQKQKWLGMLTEEHCTASYCLSEPDAGSDAAGLRTTAVLQGDHYVLNGTKAWVSGGAYARFFTLFATTDPGSGYEGITCFVIPADADGIEIGKKEDMMGQRASNTVFINFQDVKVPVENRIGDEGKGFQIAMKTFDRTRPGVAAAAVGIGRRALEESVRYAQERKAFGKPIARQQAIQFMLADMARDVEAARLLTYQSAWMIDQGTRNTKQCSMAKCFAGDMAMRVSTDAVQVFGGYGYSKEYPVEKLMRDAKVMQIYEGTNQIQRIIIARHLLEG
ncbi:acyl-CoA dehydrogenase [bacterium TMED181]|nr:acyl-CoA dehydrogenase [Planctomycetota bacterium]OUW46085.1 MAG: acyl-CoA dehydrogenase [bacterium TMED181]